MKEDPIESNFHRLFVLIPSYVEHQIALLKLSLLEATVNVLHRLLTGIFLILFGSFILLFISISVAIWIGQMMHNMALGFLMVSLLYMLIMLIILYLIKPLIASFIFKSIINSLDNEHET